MKNTHDYRQVDRNSVSQLLWPKHKHANDLAKGAS
jgi:hypothetical protein